MDESKSPARRKTTIEILLPSVRRYGPGSGPPPPKISLLPTLDSTAYIIDQFVLPTSKDMTPTSRRMIHYHIGFTDLPAAKLLVPCNKVLDYVSPRELENWEYRNAERLAEEKKAQQLALKEQKMAKKNAAAAAAAAEGKRPLGRPPKAKPDESRNPSLTSPANEALSLAQQVAGPSLSTPKKRKLSMALDNEDDVRDTASDQESDEAAIRRQWRPDFVDDKVEELYDAEEEGQWVGNSKAEPVDQFGLPPFEPLGADTSRASSLASSRRDVLPPLSHPALPGRKETSIYLPKPKMAILSVPKAKQTPIPPPNLKQTSSLPTKTKQNPVVSAPSSQASTPGDIHPVFAAAFRAYTEQKAGAQNSVEDAKAAPTKSQGTQQSKQSTPIQRSETPKISQWTPAAYGRGSLSQSTEPPSSTSASRDQSQEKESKKKDKKESKPRKQKAPPPPQEEVYDVKELLDDQWIMENGQRVHKYLVLWVGEWPEGQNPTWEPLENIEDKNLVRQYHKKKEAGTLKLPTVMKLPALKPPPKKKQKPLHSYLTGKQYSSVAEAFEDGLEIEETSHHTDDDDNDVDMEKEKFVVAAVDNIHPQYRQSLSMISKKKDTEGGGGKSNSKGASTSSSGAFSALDAGLARYQQSYKGPR